MATITRGKTFGATEQVTNSKLHQLVDSATITNLTSADVDGSAGQLTIIQGSAPSSPSAGWLWYDTTNAVLRMYDGGTWQLVSRGYSYTNQSGGTLAAGDVVVFDTGNDSSVTTTTTVSDADVVGVVIIGGADGATVHVITEGYCPAVTVSGSTSPGDYLFASATVKKADPSATYTSGSFARAWSTSSTSVAAQVGGGTLTAAASSGFVTATDVPTPITLAHNAATDTQNISHSLGVLPKQIFCYANGGSAGSEWSNGVWASKDATAGNYSHGCIYCPGGGGVATNATSYFGVISSDGTESNAQLLEVTAISTTNFTLKNTLAGSPNAGTYRIAFLCIG